MASAPAVSQEPRSGTSGNGMEYVTWGRGPKTMLFIQGGPGSVVPRGMVLRMHRRRFAPYVGAGYAVWFVTRRRNMPAGHSIADMADDYAQVISEKFSGRVDLVVGESSGGMIAQYLAAFHPGSAGHVAIAVSAAEASDWAKDVDSRLARALAQGDASGAGTAFAEYLLPGERMRRVRRLIGPLIGRPLLAWTDTPSRDILVELQAEDAFNSRAVLARIQAPVLLLCGDRDRCFTKDVIEETARLIPHCTLIWYQGQGHVKAAMNRRVAHDVLAFVNRS